jgi:hypothetical protein
MNIRINDVRNIVCESENYKLCRKAAILRLCMTDKLNKTKSA